MFWKRKDKKKAAEDVGANTTATAVDEAGDEAAPEFEEPAAPKSVDATEVADEDRAAADEDAAAEDRVSDADAAPEAGEAAGSAGGGEDAESADVPVKADKDTAKDADEDADEDASAAEAGATEADDDGIQCVRTTGVLKFEDQEFEVVSNTWIIQADDGVIVIDPAHDAEAILEAVGDREIHLVACTNGYNTHIQAAVKVADETDAPIALHRRELRAWRKVHGVEHNPDIEVEGGGSLTVGDLEVDILPIPGTSVGTVAYYISERGAVFSGDTLLAGRMGTVGNDYIDYTTQLASVGEVLLSLPPDTRIMPDRDSETTVAAETKNFDDWLSMS